MEQLKKLSKLTYQMLVKITLTYDGTRAIDGGAAEFREGHCIWWTSN